MPEPAILSVELAGREEGSGSPVLLLHGFGGDRTVWNAILGSLAKEHRVLAPDLRGHGRSPFPEGSTCSFPEFEGDVLRYLDRHSIDSAHLVGLSAGAFLALWVAVHHPAKVRSLTLIGGAAHVGGHTRSVAEEWNRTLREEGAEALALRLVKDLYFTDWTDEHLDAVDRIRKQIAQGDLRGPTRWGAAILTFDLRGRLGSIRVPTLIAQGMSDVVVDAAQARFLRQSITGAELKLFPRTGHTVPVERPEELLEALMAFLRAADARPAAGGSTVLPSKVPPEA